MSEFKGTTGPWMMRCQSIGSVGTERKLVHICMEPIDPDHGMDEEQAANALLIAAAPELLEALQEMVAIVKKHTYPQPDKPSSTWGRMEAAEAVISKALGQ